MTPIDREINALRWAKYCRRLTLDEDRLLRRLLRERQYSTSAQTTPEPAGSESSGKVQG